MVEPRRVDIPLLWTSLHYGHLSPSLFSSRGINSHCPLTCRLSQFDECGHLAIVDTFCLALRCPKVLQHV